MCMADIVGIVTVPHALIQNNGSYAYITKRIDRKISKDNVQLIDMYHREIYMYCTGDTRKIIRNAEANSITDNVYKSATAGDYGKCAIDAFTQAQNCLAGGRIKRPMQIINNVLLAMLLGVTVNFIVLKVSRFNKKEDGYPPIRENGAESFISVKVNKELLKEHTSVSRESSGGGSGGGSSDFGGGSSGGGGGSSGGGHSF